MNIPTYVKELSKNVQNLWQAANSSPYLFNKNIID